MKNLRAISPPVNQVISRRVADFSACKRQALTQLKGRRGNAARLAHLIQEAQVYEQLLPLLDDDERREAEREQRLIYNEIRSLLPASPTVSIVRPSNRPRVHRRQHRTQARGRDDPDDAEADPSDFPAPSAWGQDPALDDGWEKPTPPIRAHAERLDSLHQPAPAPVLQHPLSCIYRHSEERPDPETLIPWDRAKRSNLELAERLARRVDSIELAGRLRTCQHYLIFRPLVDGRWIIPPVNGAVLRCGQRLCPCDQLAHARKLRPQIDHLAEQIGRHGQLVFATLKAGRCSPAELWAAWKLVQKRRPFARDVLGYFTGLHVSRSLRPHLHAVLVVDAETNRAPAPLRTVNKSRIPSQLPAICHTQHAKAPLSVMWSEACRARSLPSGEAYFEAVHSPAQALQYIARPAVAALTDDSSLLPLFSALKDVKTLSTAGIVRDCWQPTTWEPEYLGGPGEARRFGWDEDCYEITPPE